MKKSYIRLLKNQLYKVVDPNDRYHITAGANFVWFRIAKSATRSILKTLKDNAEITLDQPYCKYKRKDHEGKFKFCFVRNPYDRLVSCYSDKVINKTMYPDCWDKDFDFFVEWVSRQDLSKADRHIRLQSTLFPHNEVDFIGRLENFEMDFQYVCEKLNIEFKVEHKNKSERRNCQEYYSEETRNLVANIYAADIMLGDYKF